MNNELTIFSNKEFGEVRTMVINGEPWFVGKDVASILGYTNPSKALTDHVDEEDKGVTKCYTLGGTQNLRIINESGLYSLILSSKLPNAKKFKRWVTSEVLPSIRKHGAYMTNETIEKTLTDPDFIIRLATELKHERQARQLAESTLKEQRPLVDFANQVSNMADLIDMKTMAKLLKTDHINIGRNRLFEFLRDEKILMHDNLPYQQYVDAGYFKVKEVTYKTPYGNTKVNRQTFITGKGQAFVARKVKEFWTNVIQ